MLLTQKEKISSFNQDYSFIKLVRKASGDDLMLSESEAQSNKSHGKMNGKKELPKKEMFDLMNEKQETLWPLFSFEVKNKIVLDSCFALMFDSLDLDEQDGSKYAMQLCLFKIFGRAFGLAKTDFMAPLVSNDMDAANLPKMIESLQSRPV